MRARQIGRKIIDRRIGSACHAADWSRFGSKNRPQNRRMSQLAAVIPPLSGARFLGHSPVDSGKKITELRGRNRHRAVGDRRPQKPSPLKPLGEQTRALSVVPDNLDQVASSPAEDPQIAGMRIALECFRHQKRQ